MDTTKFNRVINLRAWFSGKTLPTKEKSYLSQLMSGKISFGEKAARRLEQTYGMPDGFLDEEPTSERVEQFDFDIAAADPSFFYTLRPHSPDQMQALGRGIRDERFERIPMLSAVGSMGNGENLSYDGDQIIDVITVSKSWLLSEVRVAPENLRVVTGAGDSMLPTFGHGDLLLIDISHKRVDIDGVYAMSANDRLYIKRVRQKISGEFEVSSDNPNVKTVDILNGHNQITIHGRVVFAWNGRKL